MRVVFLVKTSNKNANFGLKLMDHLMTNSCDILNKYRGTLLEFMFQKKF